MNLDDAIKVLKDLQKCDLTSKLVITKSIQIILEELKRLQQDNYELKNSIPKKRIQQEIDDWKNIDKLKSEISYNQDELVKVIINTLQELLKEDR